jgi:hypothetical protein
MGTGDEDRYFMLFRLEFNGEKTIQKICGIIKTHILHVKTYL